MPRPRARTRSSRAVFEFSPLESRRLLTVLHWTGAVDTDFLNAGN